MCDHSTEIKYAGDAATVIDIINIMRRGSLMKMEARLHIVPFYTFEANQAIHHIHALLMTAGYNIICNRKHFTSFIVEIRGQGIQENASNQCFAANRSHAGIN